MQLYGTGRTNLTALSPGDRMLLFDGTETPVTGMTSLAFVRAPSPGEQLPAQMVFTIDFAAAPTATVIIQGASADVPARYQTLKTDRKSTRLNSSHLGISYA